MNSLRTEIFEIYWDDMILSLMFFAPHITTGAIVALESIYSRLITGDILVQ
jgi:hypothetical protein